MAWARLDDGFFCHPKVTRVWDLNPGAVGLWVRLISYCSKYETDGFVPETTVAMLSPDESERSHMVKALIEGSALVRHEDGFVVQDYLDYNPSREQIAQKRESDAARKRKARG
jgi:hypothetical protein